MFDSNHGCLFAFGEFHPLNAQISSWPLVFVLKPVRSQVARGWIIASSQNFIIFLIKRCL